MASGVQDYNRTESDRLNEIKGHLEIALLEKHFLRKYRGFGMLYVCAWEIILQCYLILS